jgi:hypothetical protein
LWRLQLVLLVGPALLAGCATKEPKHGDYKAWAAQPTPPDWKAGAVWTFVATKKSGERDSFTFRLTNEVAQTCEGGTWRKLEVLSGHILQVSAGPSQPAFRVEGAFLSINLIAPWCDVYDKILGRLDGNTFTGDREIGGITGRQVVGPVRGSRSR